MTAGLTIYNDYGNMQIDSDYRNLSAFNIFRTDGVRPPYTSSPYPAIPTWSNASAFAISPNPDQGFAFPFRDDDPNHAHRAAQAGALIYEFTENIVYHGERSGLELFDASGNMTYSSSAKGMNVIDYVKVDISQGFSKNYGSSKIAVVPTVLPLSGAMSSHGWFGVLSAGFSLSSSGLLTTNWSVICGYSVFYVADWKIPVNSKRLEFLVIDTSMYY